MRINELTNYPSIFNGAYWSGIGIKQGDDSFVIVIQNRNEFVEKFNIKKRCSTYPDNLDLYCNITIGKGYEKILRLKNNAKNRRFGRV